MKLLLTGATGYLGSHLARDFVKSGNELAGLVRPQSDLRRILDLNGQFTALPFSSDEDIEAHLSRFAPDVILHTACNYGRDGETPLQIEPANIRFGSAILQGLKRLEKRVTFINCGTALPPEVSPYALTKHQFSQIGRGIANASDGQIQFINLVLQHFYGPDDHPSKFTSYVIRSCQSDQAELDLRSGQQKRDLIYIEDVVNAVATIMDARHRLDPVSDIEVGSGNAPTVRDFIETVHRLTGSKTKLNFGVIPYRPHEPMRLQADISKLRRLGWSPRYDIEAGLKKILESDRTA